MYCKFCNSVIPDDAVFCPNCGTPVEDMLEETGVLTENNNTSDYYGNHSNIPAESDQNIVNNVENISERNSIQENVPEAYVNPQYQNSHNQYQNIQQNSFSNTNINDLASENKYQNDWKQQTSATASQENYNYTNISKPNIINCYKKFWKNYTNFSGRSRRSEYWYVVLSNIIISIVLSPLCAIPYVGAIFTVLLSIYNLAIFIPSLALVVRRLHDIGKEWYYIFFALIPIAGAIILLLWYCQDSQPGPNNFGENPKGIN